MESTPLLGGNKNLQVNPHTHSHSHTPHKHSHSHSHTLSSGPNSPKNDSCTNHHYMSIAVNTPNQQPYSYSVLRADCSHTHSSVLEPQFSTYQQDCELSQDPNRLEKFLHDSQAQNDGLEGQVSRAINISLYVNIVLFAFKCYAYYLSGSLSIAASVVDSFLDLCVQVVIYLSNRAKTSSDSEEFPVGTDRFEEIGLLLCSALMFIAGLQLIFSSLTSLWAGESTSVIDFTAILTIVGVIVLKSALWYYCYAKRDFSPTIETLAFDHRNDVLSNLVALAAILFVAFSAKLWWVDPIGCIAISIYIAMNWYELAMEKIHQLVGKSADADFIASLHLRCQQYHPTFIEVDSLRVYHFGRKFLVEIDIVLPPEMTVKESHDIAVMLQQHVESLEEVERVFVHVDYLKRDIDEHDRRAVAEMRLAELRNTTPIPPV